MRAFLLQMMILSALCCAPAWADKGEGGGDSVNNGGGLSEQALVYSAKGYRSFLESCLKFPLCGGKEPVKASVRALLGCPLPSETDLRFGTTSDSPELIDGTRAGKPYAGAEGNLLINRAQLYTSTNEALRIPGALGYLARIYLDRCGVLPYAESKELAATLSSFANFDGEQVTIGKDDLNLPSTQWIRVRTLYSDLIIEGPSSIHRLSCPKGDVSLCSLVFNENDVESGRFKNLSLVSETKLGPVVSFFVEGNFASRENSVFQLEASFSAGKLESMIWNGRKLAIPKDE